MNYIEKLPCEMLQFIFEYSGFQNCIKLAACNPYLYHYIINDFIKKTNLVKLKLEYYYGMKYKFDNCHLQMLYMYKSIDYTEEDDQDSIKLLPFKTAKYHKVFKRRLCSGVTLEGNLCKNKVVNHNKFCYRHCHQSNREWIKENIEIILGEKLIKEAIF